MATKGRDWFALMGIDASELTVTWPLIGNPTYVFTTIVCYLFLVNRGQKWMRDRKPYDLRRIMIVHNFSLVAFSTWMFVKMFRCTILRPSFHICEGPDHSIPCNVSLAAAAWWWYISKLIDLFDTTYLVLRKKPVSVLHCYHHTSVLLLAWVIAKYLPGGSSLFGPMMNSFVHMVMYTYYALSAMGPHMQKYLWWKTYLTKLQMTQFVILFVYTFIALAIKRCNYPTAWIVVQILYASSLFALFANFYYQTYIKGRGAKKRALNGSANGHSIANGHYENGSTDHKTHDYNTRQKKNGTASKVD